MHRESRSVLLGMIILQQTSALHSKNLNFGFWFIVPCNDNTFGQGNVHNNIYILSRCNVTAMVNKDEVQSEALPGNDLHKLFVPVALCRSISEVKLATLIFPDW